MVVVASVRTVMQCLLVEDHMQQRLMATPGLVNIVPVELVEVE